MTVFKVRPWFLFHESEFLGFLKVYLIWHAIHHFYAEFIKESESGKINAKSRSKKKL